MSVLITICCRAGSKGLPGKHMLDFNGKPLIRWTIECAQKCNLGPIAISTDDQQILGQIVNENWRNCFPVVRPSALALDDTPKLDVLRHIINSAPAMAKFDTIIDLDATNPCRKPEHIHGALALFQEKNADVVFSVTKAKKNPFFNQVANVGDVPMLILGSGKFTSRQDAPTIYDMNSGIYVYRREWLEDPKNVHPVCENSCAYIMPSYSFCDIDDAKDFYAAEALHRRYCLDQAAA